jgi:assimilatory nitrate reductase catalytic subunit
VLARIESLLALGGVDTLRYADKKHGQRRAVRLSRDGETLRLEGFLLGGDTRAEAWIKTLLQDRLPAQAYGRLLLRPGATAPAGVAARGKVVCSCFGITQTAIGEQLAAAPGTEAERLGALQGALKCGTNCGSCLPELKRMVRASAALSLAELS